MIYRMTQFGRGRGSHTHLAYVRPDGTGTSTTDHKHFHPVVFVQAQEEVVDQDPMSPMFGQVIQAATEGFLQVVEAEGHTHDLLEVEPAPEEEKPKTTKEAVEEVLIDLYEDQEREKASRDAGKESENMYCHVQWDEQLKRKVEAKDRAAHTINGIEARIDTLTGYQKQNRTDFKFYPTENGDASVADILNIVAKNISESCWFSREESKVFEDTALTGRGLFNIYEDYDRNIYGDIVIERYTWDEAFFGPHDKEDLSDCDRLEKIKWYSPDKLKELYPEKYEELHPETKGESSANTFSEDWDKRLNELELYDGRNYKLVEQWKKIYKRAYVLVNAADEFVYNAEALTEAEVNAVRKIEGFRKISRITSRMQVRKVASQVLLEDEYVDEEDFEVVPLYGKFRNKKFWGKVEGVKDLQRLLNKAYSQFSDIINKVANYGWFYDEDTFASKKDEKYFTENASSPGFMAKLSDLNKKPQQVEGVKFPSELVNAIQLFSGTMRELMNVNLEMQGQGGEMSGIAMRQKIVQQLLGNDFIFDNLSFAKKKIGQMIVKKVQKLYTPDRILRIVSNQNQKEEVKIGETPYEQVDQMALRQLLETADLSEYDVIASESPSSPSAMMSNFMLMMELAGKGVQIPPQAILEFAPIPQKGKIMEMISQAMEQQTASEDKKYQTEIAKSMIAQGGQPQI